MARTSRDFVARGRPLRGQKRLAPLAKRSTCSKSRGHFAGTVVIVLHACLIETVLLLERTTK